MTDSAALPRVLLIAGSLRAQSLNRQLAEHAASILKDHAHAELLEWADVPVFNQDDEFPAPQPVARVRQAVKAADALWIVTPEYNHGVPGPLKNLIDWLSRPLEDGGEGVIVGKTVTFSSVAGSSCGRYSLGAWLPTVDFLKLEVVPVNGTGVSFDRAQFTSSVLKLSDAAKTSVEAQAQALLKADFLKLEVVPVNGTGVSFDRAQFTSSVLKLSDAAKTSVEAQAQALLKALEAKE